MVFIFLNLCIEICCLFQLTISNQNFFDFRIKLFSQIIANFLAKITLSLASIVSLNINLQLCHHLLGFLLKHRIMFTFLHDISLEIKFRLIIIRIFKATRHKFVDFLRRAVLLLAHFRHHRPLILLDGNFLMRLVVLRQVGQLIISLNSIVQLLARLRHLRLSADLQQRGGLRELREGDRRVRILLRVGQTLQTHLVLGPSLQTHQHGLLHEGLFHRDRVPLVHGCGPRHRLRSLHFGEKRARELR